MDTELSFNTVKIDDRGDVLMIYCNKEDFSWVKGSFIDNVKITIFNNIVCLSGKMDRFKREIHITTSCWRIVQ